MFLKYISLNAGVSVAHIHSLYTYIKSICRELLAVAAATAAVVAAVMRIHGTNFV